MIVAAQLADLAALCALETSQRRPSTRLGSFLKSPLR
jgi:hypothetical protein